MLGLLVVSLWLIPLLLLLLVGYVWMPRGKTCPCCGEETLRLRCAWLHALRDRVHLRWCLECGWEGFTRSGVGRRAPARWIAVAEDVEERDRDAPSPG
jgi:hypothetical protein